MIPVKSHMYRCFGGVHNGVFFQLVEGGIHSTQPRVRAHRLAGIQLCR